MTTRPSNPSSSKPVNLDRRRFLSHAGTGLGVVLANPKLGLLSAALGGGALVQAQKGFEETSGPRQTPPFEPLSLIQMEGALASVGQSTPGPWILASQLFAKRFLRSGEPLDKNGSPFGYGVSTPAVLTMPLKPTDTGRPGIFVVVPHSALRTEEGLSVNLRRQSVGVSTVELSYEEPRGWRHNVSTSHNRTWNGLSPIVFDGIVKGERQSREAIGLWASTAAITTPWHSVLVIEQKEEVQADDVGYLSEINLTTGTLIKRLAVGCVDARALTLVCRSGQPLKLYLLGSRLYRYISREPYDSRHSAGNSDLFNDGILTVADLDQKKWIPATSGDGTRVVGTSLAFDEKNQSLLGVWNGRVHQIKEKINDTGEQSFEVAPYELRHLPDWVESINQINVDRRGDAWISAAGSGYQLMGFALGSGKNKGAFAPFGMRASSQPLYFTTVPGSADLVVCTEAGGGNAAGLWMLGGFDAAAEAARNKVSK